MRLFLGCADAEEDGTNPGLESMSRTQERAGNYPFPTEDARAIVKLSRRWTTGRLAYNSSAHPVAIPDLGPLPHPWGTTRYGSDANAGGGAVASEASGHLPVRSSAAPLVRPAFSMRRKRAMLCRLHVHAASRARNRGRRSLLWWFTFLSWSRLRGLPLSSLSLQFLTVSLHAGQHIGLCLFCPC